MMLHPSRRRFLAITAAGALAVGVHSALPARAAIGPNEKLNIAGVGCNGQANYNLNGVASENVVALCDVDENNLNGRAAKSPDARKYRDFRVMLEKEADKIDAVVVATPDHTHAPAAAMALRLKKHVYCEKPLTHTVHESRVLATLAKENNLVTQMGTQIHAGDNYRRVVELIQAGTIGPVREAHVWVSVNQSGAKFTTGKEAPPQLNWDLWLGPTAERPYSEGCHPFNWRRFWAFGNGGIGDFGCHYGDLVFWALDLKHPTAIRAHGPEVDPVSTAAGLVVEYDFPARGALPALKYTWHDGDKRPAAASKLLKADGKPLDWGSAQLFIGETGAIVSNYGEHLLFRDGKQTPIDKRPPQTIPNSVGHHREWLQAIKEGKGHGSTTCNFEYSGALTETVLLGNVAFRAGEAIAWDGAAFKVTNSERGQALLHKEYRKGWTL